MSNFQNSTVMTTNNSILVSCVRSNKSDNNVWAVSIQGEEQVKSYCKSPYKAMRYAFLLKKQTGFYINDISLTSLSLEIKRLKELKEQKESAALTPEQEEGKAASKREQSELAQDAEQEQARLEIKERIDAAVEQFVEEHSVDNVLAKADKEAKAKTKGKRKSAKPKEASAKKKEKVAA